MQFAQSNAVRSIFMAASLLACVTCSSSDSSQGPGKVIESKTVTVINVLVTQPITLGKGTALETIVDVPPGATAGGVEVTVSLMSGVSFGAYSTDAAIDVGPPNVVIVNPLRVRRQVAAAPAHRRYIAVQKNPDTGATIAKAAARRVFDPTDPPTAQTERWEADVDEPGVWGLALDPNPLAKSADGFELEDSVSFFETEQVQHILIGAIADRRIITVPAAAPAAPAMLGPVVASPKDWERSFVLDSSKYELTPQAQVSKSRAPIVAEVVAVAPPAARTVPLPASVLRLRPPPAQPGLSVPRRPVTITQTIPPPAARVIEVVPPVMRGNTPVGPFTEVVSPPISVVRSQVRVPGAMPASLAYEYAQPVDDTWYGLGISADTAVIVPDAGVPDGGVDGGVDTGAPPDAALLMGGLVAEPTMLNLGTSSKGTASAPMKVVIRNPTNQSSGTMQYSFVGGDAARFALENSTCAGQIEPGGICNLFISFTPTEAKMMTTTLRAKGSVAGTTDIAITATGSASKLVVNLSEHDFGNVKVNQDSGAVVLTYTNVGNASTMWQTFYGSGNDGAAFETIDSCYGKDLAMGESCNATVKFVPTTIGKVSILIEFRTVRDNSSAFTTLTGTGVP